MGRYKDRKAVVRPDWPGWTVDGTVSMEKTLTASRSLEKIVTAVGELPASPVIMQTLMGLTSDVNTDIEKIRNALLSDQSLTAKVLRLSNSTFYGRSKEVKTLDEAIVILGFQTLRSLAIATSTYTLYHGTGRDNIEERLWEHSMATAIACRLLASKCKHPQREEAFICGLLHDIGKLVLIQKRRDEYLDLLKTAHEGTKDLLELEQRQFEFTHADIGLVLLNKWSFPPVLSSAVYEHHNPQMADDSILPLSALLQLGDTLARQTGIGLIAGVTAEAETLPATRQLALDTEALDALREDVAKMFDEERKLFTTGSAAS
jgi:putative nucleotidyltransferase with HDIG domain